MRAILTFDHWPGQYSPLINDQGEINTANIDQVDTDQDDIDHQGDIGQGDIDQGDIDQGDRCATETTFRMHFTACDIAIM